MRLFNRYYSVYDLFLLLGDIAFAVVATAISRLLMILARRSEVANWNQWMALAVVIAVLIVVSFYYADLYEIDQTLSERELTLRFTNGFGVACLVIGAVSYSIQEPGAQNIYLIEISLIGVGLLAWRLGFIFLLRKARIRGKLLILGTQQIGRQISEQVVRQKHLGMEVVGFIGSRSGQITLSYGNPRRVSIPVFPRQSILQVAAANGVSRILIAEDDGKLPGQDLVTLRLQGVPIEDCHSFYERLMSKISIADLHPGWIVRSKGFRRTRWIVATKRVMDVLVSAVGLILASPFALIAAIAIKLDSVGPVFYCQKRVGQDERPFTLYKFRSMRSNAESETGPTWARENDPRVTRVGRILRKLRVDEIPQMFNVLKGEMSFVGPRPERPFFVASLKDKIPYYQLRFSVKPGVTGWAQISYSYADSEEDAVQKLEYDLYYLKHMGLMFDLQIMFETVKVILLTKGAQ
jgi:sugar transferase (PEP-CTERM system associated)